MDYDFSEILSYIKQNATIHNNGFDFVGCGRKKELCKARFYSRLTLSTINIMFKGFTDDKWEYLLMCIERDNEIKQHAYKIGFSYLVEEIMNGYKSGNFSELNPSSLYILPYKEKNCLHIYIEIETFPFKNVSTM